MDGSIKLPGFTSSLTLDVPQESPWEIGINTEGGSHYTVKEFWVVFAFAIEIIHHYEASL